MNCNQNNLNEHKPWHGWLSWESRQWCSLCARMCMAKLRAEGEEEIEGGATHGELCSHNVHWRWWSKSRI